MGTKIIGRKNNGMDMIHGSLTTMSSHGSLMPMVRLYTNVLFLSFVWKVHVY